MKKIALLGLAAAFLAPLAASAASIDSTLIPDGTYTVKVERVTDAQHVTVVMNNGIETTLVATGSVSFTKVKANDTIKVSVLKGKVPVYAIQ
jgi:type 1 fimbria pilin